MIGWNLPQDVVGAGVYGGIVARGTGGRILIGDEWPENNQAPPAHNPVHSTGPYLDFSKYTHKNRGYTDIAHYIMRGDARGLHELFDTLPPSDNATESKKRLANLVMTGGARPLHMSGMSRGGDATGVIRELLAQGADPNALDNYDMTPLDRLASNAVGGGRLIKEAGGLPGYKVAGGAACIDWTSPEFAYEGPGEVPDF